MENSYSRVCKKIVRHYSHFLKEKEIKAINKLIKINNYENETKTFINKIIDRIWQMTLTKKESFKQGKSFVFLTTRDLIPHTFNADFINDIHTHQNHNLELISNEFLLKQMPGLNGLIVEIDFLSGLSDPILPIDFNSNQIINIKSKLSILGVYHISLNLNSYDVYEDVSTDFAELTSNKLICLNKPLYNYLQNNPILDQQDQDHLTNCLIVYYLSEKNLWYVKLRDKLNNKYQHQITNKYNDYFSNKISLEEFINFVFTLLDNDPDIVNSIARLTK